MLELWPCIEADFQREYRLDLLTALPILSWRRFLALLSGLTASSAFITALKVRREREASAPIADLSSIAAAVRARRR
jgi:hypothetical protein